MRKVYRYTLGAVLSFSCVSAQAQWSSKIDPFAKQTHQVLVNQHGFDGDYVDNVLMQATYKSSVMDILNRSPAPSSEPSPGTWTRYQAKFVTNSRIQNGVAFWRQYADHLQQAEHTYGVPAEYIVAILGVESAYGKTMGKMRVLDALTTGAFNEHRRQDLYQKELIEFFLMCRENRLDPLAPIGNYAGAMGYGQFLPSSVRQYAVDADRDGQSRIDQPVDAIYSIAHYFQQHGWEQGAVFSVPATTQGSAYKDLMVGWRGEFTLRELAKHGVTPAASYDSKRLSLIRLRHNDFDEYRIGGQNFYVVTRYNNSTRYAMAVHELSQAIKNAR